MSFMLLLSTILMATRLSLDLLVSADISLSKNPLIYFYELPLVYYAMRNMSAAAAIYCSLQ
jgi:hypothetical protein